MTRLITVTQAHNRETLLINIDSIRKVTLNEYSPNANATIELNNDETINVVETVDNIKSVCNS